MVRAMVAEIFCVYKNQIVIMWKMLHEPELRLVFVVPGYVVYKVLFAEYFIKH